MTSLRFLAALYVLLYHYVPILSVTSLDTPITRIGFTGVTFFFVLSGFILAHNYKSVDFTERHNIVRYFVARVSRIFPVYLLSLMVSIPFALASVLKMPEGTLKVLAASSAVFAPLGLHSWLPGAACTINCPTWSISTELFFYVMFPILVLPVLSNPGRWLATSIAAWLAVCTASQATWDHFVDGPLMIEHDQTLAIILEQAIKYFPVGRLPEFVVGIVLYAIWKRHRERIRAGWALAAFAAAGMAIVLFAGQGSQVFLHNGLTAIAWAPLILAAASMKGGILLSAPAIFLGRMSFALYLFHVPVISLITAVDKRIGAPLEHAPLLALIVVTSIALATAAIVYRYVEEPSRRPVAARLQSASVAS